MAAQSIRVMFRFHVGVPFRQASAEEKAKGTEQLKHIYAKWKSVGVKLVGYFGAYGDGADGYAHHLILDVPKVTMLREMNNDVFGLGGIYQKHSFEVGAGGYGEEIWESA